MFTIFVIDFVQVLRWTFLMFVASWSAISLPRIPTCEGIYVNVILVPADFRFIICYYLRYYWAGVAFEVGYCLDRLIGVSKDGECVYLIVVQMV